LKEVVEKKSAGIPKKRNGKSMSNISDVFVPRGESAMSQQPKVLKKFEES